MAYNKFKNDKENDSDCESDYWESNVIWLDPGQVWEKPANKIGYLTNASSTFVGECENSRCVLCAEDWSGSVCLCCLFKSHPTQVMKAIWRGDQDVTFANHGNHPMAISILTRSVSMCTFD